MVTLCQLTNWAWNWAVCKTSFERSFDKCIQCAIGHTWVNWLGGPQVSQDPASVEDVRVKERGKVKWGKARYAQPTATVRDKVTEFEKQQWKGSEGDERIRRVCERERRRQKRECGRVKEPKRNRVNKACKNIISPDQAAPVTTTANNESDFISRADWW